MNKRKAPDYSREKIRLLQGLKKGFTLIELVCVVALLAILAAVAIPAYSNMQESSAEKVAKANARTNYSIGKANDAVRVLDPSASTEDYLGDLKEDSWDGSVARWKGEINGKVYEEYYSGAPEK